MGFPGYALTASRASVATLAIFATLRAAKTLVGEPPQTLVVAKSALFRFRLAAKTARASLLLSPRNPLRWACAGTPSAAARC